jgi:hypothetical protein
MFAKTIDTIDLQVIPQSDQRGLIGGPDLDRLPDRNVGGGHEREPGSDTRI